VALVTVCGMPDDMISWVVSAAMQADPSLDLPVAEEMAARAIYLVEQQAEPDAPAVARTLLEDFEMYGASTASVVARAAVDTVTGQQP
jgi:hypothetical protein